jgi:PBP1b-binding outer membrane lipoprotein LpoB
MVRDTKENTRKYKMKTSIIILALLLSGCAITNSEVNKSLSRDQTMEKMAKTALINEMLNSPDPHVRAKGASIAEKFLTEPKKNIFGF